MLGTAGGARAFRSIGSRAQDPIGEALRVEQFTRLAVFRIWVAGVFLVKAAKGRREFLRIAWSCLHALMMAAAAFAAGAFFLEIDLGGHAPELEGLRNIFLDGMLDLMQFVLRFKEAFGHGVFEQGI